MTDIQQPQSLHFKGCNVTVAPAEDGVLYSIVDASGMPC